MKYVAVCHSAVADHADLTRRAVQLLELGGV